jgi:hypothetical protein
MSIRTTIPEAVKVKYRKVKIVPVKVKAAVYGGCKDPGATIQFHQDVQTYGLYEALLYVENMEEQGLFAKGTAQQAALTLK